MSNVLRLAVVDPNDSQRESLKSILLGMDQIWLETECSSYEDFADVMAQTKWGVPIVVRNVMVLFGELMPFRVQYKPDPFSLAKLLLTPQSIA